MTAAARAKVEAIEQAAVRLVGARPADQFTLIETIIAEIRALPENEVIKNFYSVEGAEMRRRNERRDAARVVAWEQLAKVCLHDDTLRHHLRKAGL